MDYYTTTDKPVSPRKSLKIDPSTEDEIMQLSKVEDTVLYIDEVKNMRSHF